MSKIIGIDLGTTNSAVAVVEGGEGKILENAEGNRTTPSMVALGKGGERLVGVTAKRQAVTNPKNTIFSVKRLIGRRFKDAEVQQDKELLPYAIREAKNGGVEIEFGDTWVTPQEVSAMVLQKLKSDAEARLGSKVTEAVITVPAYFDDSQRKATQEAGKIAGLNVKRIINEPTAAALAYGLEKKKDEQIVVYDFGGGTFDVSVLDVSADTVEVKATGGDTHLGGDDLDRKVIQWVIEEFKKQEGVDLANDPLALQRIKDVAERAKIELSSRTETELNIPFVASAADGPKHLVMTLSRSKLEELVRESVEKAADIVKQVVKEAGFSISDIDEIVLVGGQTRMPLIRDSVKEIFGKDPHQGINPDEVVAVGAAIQAGILQGDVKDVLLLDVTPLTLGIETLGGVSTPLVEKNTTIPVSRKQVFSTAADNQPQVEVHVLQGERSMTKDNKSLGRFILDGIPPSPRGTPQVEVTFDIDANGVLKVSAKDKASGKEQSIRIEASTGLSDEEIARMKKDAEEHATEDKAQRELVEVKNEAEAFVFSAEKALQEHGDKVSGAQRKEIEEKVEAVKKVKDGSDASAIRVALEEASAALQEIGKAAYDSGDAATPEKPDEPKEEDEGKRAVEDAEEAE